VVIIKINLSKKDIFFLLVIILCSLLIKFPAFSNLILAGDSVSVATLTENLHLKHSYSINAIPHLHWPPLFPLSATIFDAFINNPVVSTKIASLFFSSLTLIAIYLFCRRLKFSSLLSLITTLFVIFNPFFLYFGGGIMPLAETLSVFLFTLSLYFYYFYEKKGLLITGILFSLCLLTKLNNIAFIIPFLALHSYYILRKKDIKLNIGFIFVTLLPSCLWFLRNKLMSTNLLSSEYYRFLSYEHLINFPSLFLSYFISIILLFSFLIPLILMLYKQMDWISAKHKKLMFMVLSSLVLGLFMFSIMNFHYNSNLFQLSISRTRFFVSLIPVFTIFAFYQFSKRKISFFKIKALYLAFVLIIMVLASILLTSGFVQHSLREGGIELPSTYIQRSYDRSQAIDWVNDNINNNFNEDSTILVYLNEDQYGMQGTEVFYMAYFNPLLNIISLKDSSSKELIRDVITASEVGVNLSNAYVLSDEPYDDLLHYLRNDGIFSNNTKLQEIEFSSEYKTRLYRVIN
jgi:hypothetical protein